MKELRTAEIRGREPTADGSDLVLYGQPVVFGQVTTINSPAGQFNEIIEAGALDDADISDVRLLVNHDADRIPLARTPKTLHLSINAAGLAMEAFLPDTEEARAAYKAVSRGDISSMSFGFVVPTGGDSYDAKTRTRTIHKISRLLEVSLVNFPAYKGTSVSVEARDEIEAAGSRYAAIQEARILANKIIIGGY